MATDRLLEALRARQEQEGLSLRSLAGELGLSHVLLSLLFRGERTLSKDVAQRIQVYLRPRASASLAASIEGFITSNVHRSPKTQETLRNRLEPFAAYLAASAVTSPLDVTFEHLDGYLKAIAKDRRGKALSTASMFDFTKDVRAFVHYVAENLAPEGWSNPARRLKLIKPAVTIHPLSPTQVGVLLGVADSYAPTEPLKARNRMLLYVLLDGALRISELLTATRYQLGEDGILRVMGKGGKEREVALSPKTLDAIAAYMALRTDRSPYLLVT